MKPRWFTFLVLGALMYPTSVFGLWRTVSASCDLASSGITCHDENWPLFWVVIGIFVSLFLFPLWTAWVQWGILMDEKGISQRTLGAPLVIPWATVDGVAFHETGITVRAGRRMITINRFWYASPNEIAMTVARYVNAAKAGGGVTA